MPKFIDHHPVAHAPTTEMAAQGLEGHVRARDADEFGVNYIDAYVAVNGEGYCVTEAPDADAVIKSHAALGYTIDVMDVVEVVALRDV